jgi:Cu2+-containing amine oxidase
VSRGRRWKVINRTTGENCTLTPGAEDGHRDAFGVGDLWALRRRPGQVDDGQAFTTDPAKARAHVDRFVNHESIHGTDIVLWYAGHFAHDIHHTEEVGHIVGPTLTLGDW